MEVGQKGKTEGTERKSKIYSLSCFKSNFFQNYFLDQNHQLFKEHFTLQNLVTDGHMVL